MTGFFAAVFQPFRFQFLIQLSEDRQLAFRGRHIGAVYCLLQVAELTVEFRRIVQLVFAGFGLHLD